MGIDNDPQDPTKVDTTASQACTRSGAFALVLSAVLFVLVASWVHRTSETALAQYITYRFNLQMTIERLDDNPVWQKFTKSNGTIVSTPLAQLPSHIASVPDTAEKKPSKRVVRKSQIAVKASRRPSAPTELPATITIDIPEIPALVDSIQALNNSYLLTESRNYSNYFEISIAHWVQKRKDLIYRNALVSHCTTKMIEVPHENQVPVKFVPAIDSDVLLTCLNLSDVRELVEFERPEITNPDQIGAHVGKDIDILPSTLPGTMPRDPYSASLISNVFLFFVLMYFAAFAQEAILSERFPVRGTIFGAFSRSRWTLLVMLVALCTPFIASLAVAIESRRRLLWTESVFILLAVISILVILQRKSYWADLLA
jgi:hypothetical protein